MQSKRRFLGESLLVRLGFAFGTIVMVALAATISATVFTELSSGKATAINLAGGLRMQSYGVALRALLQAGNGDRSGSDLDGAIADFEGRLNNRRLVGSLPSDPDHPTRQGYARVAAAWDDTFKPAIAATVGEGIPAGDVLITQTTAFVRNIEDLVSLLEFDLEQRIQVLRVIQGVALFAIVAVMFLSLYIVHAKVLDPLAGLLQCARRVQAGDFTVRAQHIGGDELGQLGQAFNYMVEDLSRTYARLEARAEEKTEQLARSNVSLEILYNTTRTLAENPLTRMTLDGVMSDVERVIGLKAYSICTREESEQCGFPIAIGNDTAVDPDHGWCTQERCNECFGDNEGHAYTVGSSADRMLSVPLSEGGKLYGAMLLRMPGDAGELERWKMKLLESIGHHIGAALAAGKRTDELRRIALMEERSVIARELHDSLAQSLSYLKIQATRLKAHLDGNSTPAQTAEVADELKVGLNNAYRQLRELLTTFRLRMDGRGLADALQNTVREFAQRTGIDFRLQDHLLGRQLDSSEQIHVLQVVREALANVEHHARASRADVRLASIDGRIRVTVDDDGVGITQTEPPIHHYGLAIMNDRAATLGGTLRIVRRPEGGTRVELDFSPRGPFRMQTMALAVSA